jgi:hypothetical protein
VLPRDEHGQPFTFEQLLQKLYEYIVNGLSDEQIEEKIERILLKQEKTQKKRGRQYKQRV